MKLDQIRRRVGQMFLIGFKGTTVTDELKQMIQDYYVGGVILYKHNIISLEQTASLINDLQALAKTPLFIAVDQELGKIRRLEAPFTYFGAPRDFLKVKSPKLSFDVGFAMAQELKALGFNYDFAPIVDVDSNPKNPIIGERAFSSDPQEVAQIASGFFRGLQRGGVIACAKHFPGHGDTDKDSHLELPSIKKTVEELKQLEWIPFERVIKSGIETVMTAHILNPTIDPDLPATLSKKTMDYLRNDLRFSRCIVTDDMEMNAIIDNYTIEDATLKAIDAGIDFLLICRTYENQVKAVETALRGVLDLKIPVTRIEESSERIIKLRNRYILPYEPTNVEKIKELIGTAEHQELAQQVLS